MTAPSPTFTATETAFYGEQMHAYFDHHGIALTVFPVTIREPDKTLGTVERIVDAFGAFGLLRTEPVLVVGGGLTTDVAGFACSMFRRSTNYIRVPTTLIGLIDASVAIKVAVNHGKSKTRLGQVDGSPQLREAARRITDDAIHTMLRLEVPNLRELDLDRVIAFGHTWSPTLELAPPMPFFHGHAIAIDMALSTTLAERRGYISVSDRDRIFWLLSRVGLALDSPHLTAELLRGGTESILQTRDGLLRAAVPRPVGTCYFVNDLTGNELDETLAAHRAVVRRYPRGGDGEDMFLGS